MQSLLSALKSILLQPPFLMHSVMIEQKIQNCFLPPNHCLVYSNLVFKLFQKSLPKYLFIHLQILNWNDSDRTATISNAMNIEVNKADSVPTCKELTFQWHIYIETQT